MKANEFRIGNLAKYKDQFLRIENLVKDEFWAIRRGDSTELIPLADIEPIPLTPEILEKCWFKKGNACYKNAYSRNVLDTDFYLRPSYECGFYWGFNASSTKLDCELNSVKPIKYLHQLQNLFFALTGEELEVNLEDL